MCIRDRFITHTHIDHVLGAVWMLRLVCHHLNEGDYEKMCIRDRFKIIGFCSD